MKARALIQGATYGPEALKVIGQAFDQAWTQIKHHFDGNMHQIENTRLKLAHAVLAVAREDSSDVEELKNRALQVLAMNYTQLMPDGPVNMDKGHHHAGTRAGGRVKSAMRIIARLSPPAPSDRLRALWTKFFANSQREA